MKIVVGIVDGEKNIPSPFHEDGIIESVFVTHDREYEVNKIGYLLFWCSVTHKGAIFPRLVIPQNAEYVYGEDFKNLNLQDIKLQEVDFG